MVEPDIDYFKDLGAHAIFEVVPNGLTHSFRIRHRFTCSDGWQGAFLSTRIRTDVHNHCVNESGSLSECVPASIAFGVLRGQQVRSQCLLSAVCRPKKEV